jgi:metal-sulfur cluster biosynthetic enzyme
MLTTHEVLEALRPVHDPEIALSIVDLGLVYGVRIEKDGKHISVDMTLTSPMCPYGPQLLQAAHEALARLEGVEDPKINLVWVPRWDPREHASEEARAQLGFW